MMRWILMLAIAALLFAALYFLDGRQRGAPSAVAASDPRAQAGETRIFAAGFLSGEADEIALKFELPGRIRRVLVAAGTRVKAGQPLAEIDSAAWDLQLEEAQGRLALARAQRELLLSGQTAAPWRGATTNPAPPAIPRQSTSPSKEEVNVADAQVRIAEAAVNYQKLLVERTRLIAPCDGEIVHWELSAGDLVGPTDVVDRVVLAPRGRAVVRAYVEELDALDVQVGQQAIVIAPARREQQFAGTVASCAAEVRPKSLRHYLPGERLDVRVREVTILLNEPIPLLRGLPVEVFILPPERKLVAPAANN